jgi:hypothetical protein
MPPKKREERVPGPRRGAGAASPLPPRWGHALLPGREDPADTQKILLPTGYPPDFSGRILTPLAARPADDLAERSGHRCARSHRGLQRSSETASTNIDLVPNVTVALAFGFS